MTYLYIHYQPCDVKNKITQINENIHVATNKNWWKHFGFSSFLTEKRSRNMLSWSCDYKQWVFVIYLFMLSFLFKLNVINIQWFINLYMSVSRLTFPFLLNYCAQGWVNNIVATSSTSLKVKLIFIIILITFFINLIV